MPTHVVMPQMGESIAEGTIVRWLKKVGDAVDRDEPLFEISTDKVDAEIPVAGRGRPHRDHRSRKARPCRSTRVVAMIGEAGEAGGAGRREAPPAAGQPARAGAPMRRRQTTASTQPRLTAPPRRSAATHGRPRSGRAEPSRTTSRQRRRRSCDGSRSEHDVDISQIHGSGIGGRVTKHDILGFIGPGRGSGRSGLAAPADSQLARCGPDAAPPSPDATAGPRPRRVSRAAVGDAQEDRRAHGAEPAHVGARPFGLPVNFSTVERDPRGEEGASTSSVGAKLTYMAFIAKAVIDALRRTRSSTPRSTATTSSTRRHQPRNRSGARSGPDRPGDQARRREEPARPEPRDRRSRRACARQAAQARRSARRHVHHHQSRAVRRAVRDADHQPAAGRRFSASARSKSGPVVIDDAIAIRHDGVPDARLRPSARSTAPSPTSSCRT